MAFATTWIDMKTIILSETLEKDIIWYHLYAESKKKVKISLFTKQKHTNRLRKQTYSYKKGRDGGKRDKLKVWEWQIHTTIYEIAFPGSLVGQNLPAVWETCVWFLGQEDPMEKEMANLSSILAWKIPWTEDPGRLPMGLPELDMT